MRIPSLAPVLGAVFLASSSPASAISCDDGAVLVETAVFRGVTTHTCMIETPNGVVAHGEHEVRQEGVLARSGVNAFGRPVGQWRAHRRDGGVKEILTFADGVLVHRETMELDRSASDVAMPEVQP